MQRELIDLSHYSFQCGEIGRLQTQAVIPVVAGDSFSVNLEGVFRLSPLRRNLTLDCMVDCFALYVPHRHIYGSDWTDFILQGIDETVTFTPGPSPAGNFPSYLGVPLGGFGAGTIPLWYTNGYNNIWNRYFRDPSDTGGFHDATYLEPTANGRLYGSNCCYPKTIWSAGINPAGAPDASDKDVPAVTTMDILDLAQIQGRYKSELQRQYFGQRYTDMMKEGWGTGVNIDADQRPELCYRKTEWLSGYDVDGTDDASLGSFSGKSASIIQMNMPRKFFKENGTFWIMSLLRFPAVHERETHYLTKRNNPTYKEWAGDPTIMEQEAPQNLSVSDLFGLSSSGTTLGLSPFGQYYRTHPNLVHPQYTTVQGFPFLKTIPTTWVESTYYSTAEYATTFQTSQLGNWQSQSRISVSALRNIITAKTSIFAGTN